MVRGLYSAARQSEGSRTLTVISQWVAVAAGVWLIGLGVWMAIFPDRALSALAAMGGSPLVHFGEMIIRLLIGAALVGAGPVSRLPALIPLIGWFLIVSAIILMVLPRRWHAAYSTWWAARIPRAAVRLVAPVAVIGGAALIWTLRWPV